MTRYFVDAEGKSLGGFDGGAEPPAGAVEVPVPPPVHNNQRCNGADWEPPAALGGVPVFSAADVDRATARQIKDALAPEWAGDPSMQEARLLRLIEDALADLYVFLNVPGTFVQADVDAARARLGALFQTREQAVKPLRQEGADFKAARGW